MHCVSKAVMRDFESNSILLGVTGGIAAYKATTIASLLVQAGATVDVVMTEAAQRFVQPLSFSTITHAPVHTDTFAPWRDDFTGSANVVETYVSYLRKKIDNGTEPALIRTVRGFGYAIRLQER